MIFSFLISEFQAKTESEANPLPDSFRLSLWQILLVAIRMRCCFVRFAHYALTWIGLLSCFLVLALFFALLGILRVASLRMPLAFFFGIPSWKLISWVRILAPRFNLELIRSEAWPLLRPLRGIFLFLLFWKLRLGRVILSSLPFIWKMFPFPPRRALVLDLLLLRKRFVDKGGGLCVFIYFNIYLISLLFILDELLCMCISLSQLFQLISYLW